MARGLLILLTLCVTTSLATMVNKTNGNNSSTEIHGTSLPLRGKRELSNGNPSNIELNLPTDTMQKSFSTNNLENDNEGDSGGLPDINDEYLRRILLPELYLYKRAPSGFVGMRGKKDYEYSDFYHNGLSVEEPYYTEFVYPDVKRTPSGFMGMRGKKAPNGFFGVRGKKDVYNLNSPGEEESDDDMSPIDKRSRALESMRGRNLINLLYGDYNDNEEIKRAPSGFVGMRGRRFLLNSLMDDNKRSPKAFYGVRGKRDYSGIIGHYEKRSALAQYLGLRGKKLYSNVFDMRGKKEPQFNFRNKFVGVRGKKTSENSIQRLESKLMSSPEDFPLADKRIPNGFVGMRGKKDSSNLKTSGA